MLLELRIAGLGIVDELVLEFASGLTVVTGETGAGKTLIVEALELLAGARADPGLVRDGESEARVEGRFDHPDTGSETVLIRVIPADGRSRAYIDGRLVTAGELTELAMRLIDLHGQHSHQSLLSPAAQRDALDAFAGAPAYESLAMFTAARTAVRAADDALNALGGDDRLRAREIALCEFQVAEIDAAAVASPDEDGSLSDEESRLADAVAIREGLAIAYDAVESTAQDAAGVAAAALAGRPGMSVLESRLRSTQAELADLASDLRTATEEVVEDPARLDAVRNRRRLLHDLCRKYGSDLHEVIKFRTETAARLSELVSYEARAAEVQLARAESVALVEVAAARLHEARISAAGEFAAAVEERLRRLAMSGARLTINVERAELGEYGGDKVTFMLSANVGEPGAPLSKVASGGELSRTMLGLRVALSERSEIEESRSASSAPLFVFDEVDAGIGGEAGVAVGRELSALARGAQVLCVTHLAQVAAGADSQIVVTKETRKGRTIASARAVRDGDRVAELSRMLSGAEDSQHARLHAEELLANLGSSS